MNGRDHQAVLQQSFRWPSRSVATSYDESEPQTRDIEAGAAALNLSSDAVHLAVEIASFEPHLSKAQRMALILLIMVALAASAEGSTRFPITGPQSIQPMRRLLSPMCGESFGVDGAERVRAAIDQLVGSDAAAGVIGTSPNDYKPLIYLVPYVYQHRSLAAEVTLARRLTALLNSEIRPFDSISPRDVASGGDRNELSDEQRLAIARVIAGPLTIISGGPGTGKTSIIAGIVKMLLRAGLDPKLIAMAAPTGKAAYRIGESLSHDLRGDGSSVEYQGPVTVHRLLGYSPTTRRFRYHHNNPLSASVVILDEASMLDLELMSRLLDALPPGARLVLLGDADQLPSVSAGAVFRDLLPAAGEDTSGILANNCVRLTHSYRLNAEHDIGGSIFKLTNAINAGNSSFLTESNGGTFFKRGSIDEAQFRGAEWIDAQTPEGAFFERWYSEQVRAAIHLQGWQNRVFSAPESGFSPPECRDLASIFDSVSRARILCVTRVFDSGSERINDLLHRRAASDAGLRLERDKFIAGEPVMVTRNDYERMLFNGDQGVILWVKRPTDDASLMAVFPHNGNFVAFNVAALKDRLELCYAMTVHKAQGSEFDSIALILPEKDIPILSREIIYTAVTRARRSVTIIGSKKIVEAGLSRKIERYSGVREQIAKCLIESQRA